MAAAAPAVRGRDRKKQDFEWVDVQKVQEFDDGWYVGYVNHHKDLATLGYLMGHCSGTHYVWACEEKIWYFFGLFDKDGVPHGTLHAKEKKWLDKEHPRDTAKVIPQQQAYCNRCNGGGYEPGQPWGGTRCKTCKGSGFEPVKPGDKVVNVVKKGLYATYEEVLAAFKAAGLEYTPGEYRPLSYNSRTYDSGAKGDYEGGRQSFDYRYGNQIPEKPDGVSDEVWAQYTKVYKSLKDEYNKNNGFIKIAGRVFKFDSKDLIVLSFSDKNQYGEGKNEYRRKIAEFLNNHTKSKRIKKEETA